jgi:galactose mutarotase-like enzyme
MFQISNSKLHVTVAAKGAELQSIVHKETGLEYMWNADSAYWPKKSPVLFPIVGTLKNNAYTYKSKSYTLNRHGFARERTFTVAAKTEHSISFMLQRDEETLKVYPFPFVFIITYTLHENELSCTYKIENAGKKMMYCSVGAHPAFKVPLTDDTTFNDWYLQFNKTEHAGKYPLSEEGLIKTEPVNFLDGSDKLQLNKELFYSDALVFKNLLSNKISLRSNKSKHGLTMTFNGFPFYGIWSFKNADFVCLEPWCGIADSVNATGEISEKEGINALQPEEVLERSWKLELF